MAVLVGLGVLMLLPAIAFVAVVFGIAALELLLLPVSIALGGIRLSAFLLRQLFAHVLPSLVRFAPVSTRARNPRAGQSEIGRRP